MRILVKICVFVSKLKLFPHILKKNRSIKLDIGGNFQNSLRMALSRELSFENLRAIVCTFVYGLDYSL